MAKTKFDIFSDKLDLWQSGIEKTLLMTVKKRAETIAGDARALCPTDTGNLKNSIEGFVKESENVISGGAVTVTEYATYVEFGTGPTGDISGGHPLDNVLGVTRKKEPWKVNISDICWRYTYGQPANPFMYTAMKQNEDDIIKEFGAAVKEVISGD